MGPPVGIITGAGVAPPEAEGSPTGGRLGAIPVSGKTAWNVGLGVEGARVVGKGVGAGVVGEEVDGDPLGNAEGPALGLVDGDPLGNAEGPALGLVLGAFVGALDGLLDGD